MKYASDDYGDCSFNYEDRTIDFDDDWYKKHKNFTINAKYKMYIPDLRSFVEESGDMKFCIQYNNWTGEYYNALHVTNGFKVQSYYIEDHYKFLKELSQWHIASVTEVASATYNDDGILNKQESYQNRWVNRKFANVKANTLRGQKVINYTVSD